MALDESVLSGLLATVKAGGGTELIRELVQWARSSGTAVRVPGRWARSWGRPSRGGPTAAAGGGSIMGQW